MICINCTEVTSKLNAEIRKIMFLNLSAHHECGKMENLQLCN